MAEFGEVMRQFRRMCDHLHREHKCPMGCQISGLCTSPCRRIAFDYPGEMEKTVMAWAAEHQEPVYPTWKEWLEEQRVVVHFDSVDKNGTKVKWELTNKSNCTIPAYIAKKLGIQPKEE